MRDQRENISDSMETPCFFPSGSYRLFGVFHPARRDFTVPANSIPPLRCIGVVLVHPFAEEKVSSHRVMVNFARYLAGNGIAVFRFDFMGHGDSEGKFEDATLETRLLDLKSATEYLKNRVSIQRLALVGVRLGATLGALFTGRERGVDSVVMINPIIKGKEYIDQCLRSNLTTQLAMYQTIKKKREQLIDDLEKGVPVNVDGYLISGELYFQIKAVDLLKKIPIHVNHNLVAQISRRQSRNKQNDVEQFQEVCEQRMIDSELCYLQGETFWADSNSYVAESPLLYSTVLDWLRRTDGRNGEWMP